MRQALFRALISLFAHYRNDEPAPVVIKFPSWSILFWSTVHSYWPAVPAIIIIRDPVEVMIANLDGRGWMKFKQSPELAGRLFGWKNLPRSAGEMSDAEFAARVLHSFYTCAREMADQGARILDYQDIDVRQIRAIAAFFHVELPASRFPIERIFGMYSKDAAGAQPFRPDGPHKQQLATGLVRSAAHQWATAAYRELMSRC
jgi:hypothetical protein